MNIDRPTFNYDNQGNALVPAASDNLPSDPQETIRQVATMDGPPPTPAQSSTPVPTKGRGFSGLPDWGDKPRNEAGQFITKSEGDLRRQWEREGGYAQNAARVMEAEARMLALSPSLQGHIATLPNDIQLVAADHLRLSPAGFAKDAGARRFEQFCDALSPSQWETFSGWWRKLSRDEQDSILGAIS